MDNFNWSRPYILNGVFSGFGLNLIERCN